MMKETQRSWNITNIENFSLRGTDSEKNVNSAFLRAKKNLTFYKVGNTAYGIKKATIKSVIQFN